MSFQKAATQYFTLRTSRTLTILAFLLIPLTAVFQALGYCQPLERSLLHLLPSRFLPEVSHTILLDLGTTSTTQGDFPAMDVAMALRGLHSLHPRCVLINGSIGREQGPVPFLPSLLSRLKEDSGTTLIVPRLSSPDTYFQSVPLTRYAVGSSLPPWPTIAGKAMPGTGSAFLPAAQGTLGLPLLATTEGGSTVGSLWWWALPPLAHKHSPLLLFGKILLLGNHATIHMTSAGAVEIAPSFSPASLKEIPLDDFLLQIEQKDQGIISPAFDALWNHSTVILGTSADRSRVSMLATLLEQASFSHPSLGIQAVMALGWMAVLFIIRKSLLRRFPLWPFPLLILLALSVTTLLLLRYGIMIPFLPGLLASLLLLIA